MLLNFGSATIVGQVRQNNQDRLFCSTTTAVVADGMGGYEGGEVAATKVVEHFEQVQAGLTADELIDLVKKANSSIFEMAQQDQSLSNMGTTVVALTLHGDNKVSVVNVGDSRAYWLRGNVLGQVTVDHSLVEEMVRQGRLEASEAETHPQKNILTRALGITGEVDVDIFGVAGEVGDRLMLCSDGIFNEIDEDRIKTILLEDKDPAAAAQRLVAEANEAGGRDNATVVVVDLVEGENPYPIEEEVVGVSGEVFDNGGDDNEPLDQESFNQESFNQESFNDTTTDAIIEDEAEQGLGARGGITKGRLEGVDSSWVKIAAGSVGLLLLLTVGYVGLTTYAKSKWFVGQEDGKVAVFQGFPDGILWVDPKLETEFDIAVEDLQEVDQTAVSDRKSFPDRDAAVGFVERLEESSKTFLQDESALLPQDALDPTTQDGPGRPEGEVGATPPEGDVKSPNNLSGDTQ